MPICPTRLKKRAIDTVTIAQAIPGRLVPGKGLNDLLRSPFRREVRPHIAMHKAAPFVGQDDEHEEHLERHGRDGKEVQGHQVLDMVRQEGLPGQ